VDAENPKELVKEPAETKAPTLKLFLTLLLPVGKKSLPATQSAVESIQPSGIGITFSNDLTFDEFIQTFQPIGIITTAEE